MNFDWQILVALLVVAVAAAYLLRQLWRSVSAKGGGGCGSCESSCPSNSGTAEEASKQLVSLSEHASGERKK